MTTYAEHAVSRRRFPSFAFLVRLPRRLAVVALLLVLWEAAVRAGLVNANLFPAPTGVLRSLVESALSGTLTENVWASLGRVFIGVAIAAVSGISAGLLLARFETLSFYLAPVIELVRPISVIAWIPVAIIWFGLSDASTWFIIALGAFFPIFTNSYHGMKQIPPVYLQAGQTLGLDPYLMLRAVLLPAALPSILAGLRIGLGVGWTCLIAAEMISATSGLGYMIQTARVLIETEQVFAGMVVIGIVGFAMNYATSLLEARLTPWLRRTA